MTRSYKLTPVHGVTTARSEKQNKRYANRALRRAVHQAVNADREPPALREVSNVWTFEKDGKTWDGHCVGVTGKLCRGLRK